MLNQSAIIIVDWLVAMLCSNELFVCTLKLKNSNCGINPLIWVKCYTKINNVHNMLDKNMFLVHIPKFYRVILNPMRLNFLLVACCSLLVTFCLLFVAPYFLLVTFYSLLFAHSSLLFARCSLFFRPNYYEMKLL